MGFKEWFGLKSNEDITPEEKKAAQARMQKLGASKDFQKRLNKALGTEDEETPSEETTEIKQKKKY